MKLQDAVVLVTGANRGIRLAFVETAPALGARKVYAGARNPSRLPQACVEPLKLAVTSAGDVAKAAKTCRDVSLLVNNAGAAWPGGLLGPNGVELTRAHLETNLFDISRMIQSIAPVLAANGGGAVLNVRSVAGRINSGVLSAYAVSRSAAWSLINGLRQQNTPVAGLPMGFVDTDMNKDLTSPSPRRRALSAKRSTRWSPVRAKFWPTSVPGKSSVGSRRTRPCL